MNEGMIFRAKSKSIEVPVLTKMERKVIEAVEGKGFIFKSYLPEHGLVYVTDRYSNTFPIFEETVINWIEEGV